MKAINKKDMDLSIERKLSNGFNITKPLFQDFLITKSMKGMYIQEYPPLLDKYLAVPIPVETVFEEKGPTYSVKSFADTYVAYNYQTKYLVENDDKVVYIHNLS